MDVASKLDRSQLHIEGLIQDGVQQARQFLQVIPSQIAFEEVWERVLRNRKLPNENKGREQEKYTQCLDTVMDLFSELPTIELVPPVDPSSGLPQTKGWKAEKDPEKVRSVLEWCVRNNLTIEQSRAYQVSKQRSDKKVATCWALATTDRFSEPIKAWVKVVVKNGKVQSLTVYPLSLKVMRGLRKEMEELDAKTASGSQ